MNNNYTPIYDPADTIISHELKQWVKHHDFPEWARSQLILKASQSSVKVSSVFMMRMIVKWVLLRGFEIVLSLVDDTQMTFIPSSDNSCLNPPHLSACQIHTKVKDTFLLEAGMLAAI